MSMQFLAKGKCDAIRLGERLTVLDCDRDVGVQLVAKPSSFDIGDLGDARYVCGRMADFICNAQLDTVKAPGNDGTGRLPDDAKDCDRNQKPDDRRQAGSPGRRRSRPEQQPGS